MQTALFLRWPQETSATSSGEKPMLPKSNVLATGLGLPTVIPQGLHHSLLTQACQKRVKVVYKVIYTFPWAQVSFARMLWIWFWLPRTNSGNTGSHIIREMPGIVCQQPFLQVLYLPWRRQWMPPQGRRCNHRPHEKWLCHIWSGQLPHPRW